jgi:hypothetical protein
VESEQVARKKARIGPYAARCGSGLHQWVDSSPLAEASWLIEHLTEREEATLF